MVEGCFLHLKSKITAVSEVSLRSSFPRSATKHQCALCFKGELGETAVITALCSTRY